MNQPGWQVCPPCVMPQSLCGAVESAHAARASASVINAMVLSEVGRCILWPQLMKGNSRFSLSSAATRGSNSTAVSTRNTELSAQKGPQLVILTYIPRMLQLRLGKVLAPRHTLIPVKGWAEAAAAIRTRHVDMMLVDPTIEGTPDVDRVAQLIADFPSVAVVAYTTTVPAAVSAVYKLSKHGLHNAMLYEFDDTRERLALLLDEIPPKHFLTALLEALEPHIAELPQLVQQKIREALEMPLRFRSVTEFTQSVNMSRPGLYRLFQTVGLRSPKCLLDTGRLVQVYAYLSDPGVSVRAAAAKVGWDPRTLKLYLKRAFGISVEHLRQHASPDDLVERAVKWIRIDDQ